MKISQIIQNLYEFHINFYWKEDKVNYINLKDWNQNPFINMGKSLWSAKKKVTNREKNWFKNSDDLIKTSRCITPEVQVLSCQMWSDVFRTQLTNSIVIFIHFTLWIFICFTEVCYPNWKWGIFIFKTLYINVTIWRSLLANL